MDGSKICWSIFRTWQSKELSSKFYVINRLEDVIQEGKEEDGLMLQKLYKKLNPCRR
jgi:hypothetical protein